MGLRMATASSATHRSWREAARDRWDIFQTWWDSAFASKWAELLRALLTMAAGYTLTLWSKEIGDTLWTPAWLHGASFAWHPTLFWAIFGALALASAGTHAAKAAQARKTNDELRGLLTSLTGTVEDISGQSAKLNTAIGGVASQADRLTDSVNQLHSLPPRGVLETCKLAYDRCDHLARGFDANKNRPPAELEALARAMLTWVEGVVRAFDGKLSPGSQIRYGVNLMIYLKAEDSAASPLKAELAGRLHYSLPTLTLDNAAGVLDILPAMSVASNEHDGDRRLQHFAMLIDEKPRPALRVEDQRPALPGAVDACINMICTGVRNIPLLKQQMADRGLPPEAQAAALAYFDQPAIRETVRSFVCVPLVTQDLVSRESVVLGILNIHRDTDNPRIYENLPLLEPLLTPLRHHLTHVMETYKPIYLAARPNP